MFNQLPRMPFLYSFVAILATTFALTGSAFATAGDDDTLKVDTAKDDTAQDDTAKQAPAKNDAPTEEKKVIALARGQLTATLPKNWIVKKPSSRILEHECSVPAEKGDKADGRVTFMAAGGGVEANIDRWVSQFSRPQIKKAKNGATSTKMKVAGLEVHLVDITGTYNDRRGPFGPAVAKENYRMLAAIVVAKNRGLYFVKFYGPKNTVAKNEKAFQGLIKSLSAQK